MFKVPESGRIVKGAGRFDSTQADGNNGAFMVIFRRDPLKPVRLNVLVSDGMGWEHASVSVIGAKRCPKWEEMCHVKDIFWDPEDTVVQFHPAQSEYVNVHPNVLHLWRPVGVEPPTPWKMMV